MRCLVEAAWPGNVRELKHALERAVLLAHLPVIGVTDLPPTVTAKENTSASFGGEVVPMKTMQRRYAEWALERLAGRKMLACEVLDIDPKTLNRLLAPDAD